ncbi:MAG: hypothetical protein ACR2IG_09990 [Roseomonas sp.]
MKRIGSGIAALGLLLSAACAPKPDLISAEKLSRPHVASIIETDPQVVLDPGRPAANMMPAAMVAPLPILAVGLLVAGAAQGIENARAETRRNRAQVLEEQLGSTGQVGAELQREFRTALTAEIARGSRLPIQRVETNSARQIWQPSSSGDPMLHFQFGSMLTQDARAVTLQVQVRQMGWKPESERKERESALAVSTQYDLVAFSAPIEAASEEDALGLWRENNYARLRQATRALIPEIMTLVRIAILEPEPLDLGNMPRVSTKMSGFSLLSHIPNSQSGGSAMAVRRTVFQPSVSGSVVRRSSARDYMMMQTIPQNPGVNPTLIWLSLPTGSF